LSSVRLNIFPIWNRHFFQYKFQEADYGTKLFEQKPVNIQTHWFCLNSCLSHVYLC
jgi:hypothetical protein